MSYARNGPNSDVYVYEADYGFVCHWCRFVSGERVLTHNAGAMATHLEEHLAAGHKVPLDAITRLRETAKAQEFERIRAYGVDV